MPEDKAKRYQEKYKLTKNDANIIANNPKMAEYFDQTTNYEIRTPNYKQIANWIVNEISDLSVSPKYLVELINLIETGKISGKMAKEILPELKQGKSPSEIIKEKGMEQISDKGKIESIVEKIIKDNPDAVKKIKSGQSGVIGFLVGQVMRETKGRANPGLVNEIIRTKIK